MGQKLQICFYAILLSVSILIWGEVGVSNAQILLENDNPLEVRFSQGASERGETFVTVGLSEIESILSPEYSLKTNQWQAYREATVETNYFVPGEMYGTAPGRIQLENSPFQTLFAVSINNNSEFSYGNIVVAFDFIYNFFENESAHNYELKYKINDGEWDSVPSGFIGNSSFRSVEDTWSSFSVHLNIDDIYLRPSDTIHLLWTIDDDEPVAERIPLALQQMEIFPEKIEQNALERGDLIITEILPVSEIDGSEFEYVEVFNPGETSISLKGVELITDNGSKVIQQDVFVAPYDFTVISNVDISSLEGVSSSYFYSGSIVPQQGGRVELERESDLIASATYEPGETGVAVELNRVSQAFDGYSSMQDFVEPQTSYYQGLYGSPGTNGSTTPMFKKVIDRRGIYLLSFPGTPVQHLNQNSSLEMYSLDGTQLDFASIRAHTPVLVKKTDNNSVTLFAEAQRNLNTKPNLFSQLTSNSQLLSTKVPFAGDESVQREKKDILQGFPVTQVWNPEQKKFNLRLSEQAENDYWSPRMIHSSVAELLETSETSVRSPLPDRLIEFGIIPENQEGSMFSDVVIVGFMDTPAQYEQVRYDLPKLSLKEPAQSNLSDDRSHLLYLTSTFSDESYNAFTHLPENINKEYELGLGHQIPDDAGGAVLRWKLSEEIPDEWIITLEDTFNGTVINLREEDEYRFRYTNSTDGTNREVIEVPELSAVSSSERSRFIFNVQPYEAFTNVSEEEEVPNSIELRPNYPNPFNPSTNINFYLPEERSVQVGVYNIVGQQVALLLDDVVQQGEHSLSWNASDKPSGIYIVQLETGNQIFTRKVTLIK